MRAFRIYGEQRAASDVTVDGRSDIIGLNGEMAVLQAPEAEVIMNTESRGRPVHGSNVLYTAAVSTADKAATEERVQTKM